jgi:hypothetical protein
VVSTDRANLDEGGRQESRRAGQATAGERFNRQGIQKDQAKFDLNRR